MSTPTFPTLAGTGWDIKKRVFWQTDVETAASGAEFRTARWTVPVYEFDLVINYLSQADQQALEAFYEGQQGPFLPFYLSIPNDPASPFLVRFKDDQLEFNQMFNAGYEVQTLTMRTVR